MPDIMPDAAPIWLATMRGIDGTEWSPNDGRPNPKIQEWLQAISSTYPNMASYCRFSYA